MDKQRSFGVTPEQYEAIRSVTQNEALSWSELQDQMVWRWVRSSYGLDWPTMPRQGRRGITKPKQAIKRGRYYVMVHVINDEQDRFLHTVIGPSRDFAHGWYTAFLEMAFRAHFEEAYGVPWPAWKRAAERGAEGRDHWVAP